MTHVTTTFMVGDRSAMGDSHADHPAVMGEIRLQAGFQPVLRRKLMAALSTMGRSLNLRASSLMVLDSLLSFLPCKDAAGKEMPITPLHLLTIYAANDTISFRARGLTDRQLRRHFEILEARGLIKRRDSANGKRFAVYQNGKVIGAYGIDMTPLLQQGQSLIDAAEQLRLEEQEIRGIKAQIMQLRTVLLEKADRLSPQKLCFLEQLRNLTRRVGLGLAQARQLLAEVQSCLSPSAPIEAPAAAPETIATLTMTDQKPAAAGQNVRHNKPRNTDPKKITHRTKADDLGDRKTTAIPDQTVWQSFAGLNCYFPDLPGSVADLKSILCQSVEMLRIDQRLFQRGLETLGLAHLTRILDRILRSPEAVEHPNRYLQSVLGREAISSRSGGAHGHFAKCQL